MECRWCSESGCGGEEFDDVSMLAMKTIGVFWSVLTSLGGDLLDDKTLDGA